MEALAKGCMGRLGWTPRVFWGATCRDCVLALEGYWEERRGEREDYAAHAAWTINGTREAFHADKFDPYKAADLYDPDYTPPSRGDIERERQELSEQFPATL